LTSAGAATVSSLMMGVAWGMGSLAVPLIGRLADAYGINTALLVMSAVPVLAATLAAQLTRVQTGDDRAPVHGRARP